LKPQTMFLKLIEQQDLERFIFLCNRFFDNSPYSGGNFSYDKVKNLAQQIIDSDKSESIIILLHDGEQAQGFIVGLTSETPFGTDKVALELAWWVEPDHRGSRKSLELMKAYEVWARKVNCNIVQMGYIENNSPPKLEEIYKRNNYTLQEKGFWKVI
jgi:Acetyltransferase (GNAT) family